jgi:uncharacterized membrane protein
MTFEQVMEWAAKAFEIVGVAILVVGGAWAFIETIVARLRGGERGSAFVTVRRTLGRAILLGLEFLVVADIIRTIVVEPTLSSALSLGIIVVVRVLLSFAIDIEVDGRVPWRAAEASARAGN